jgi:hypothetical protein
MASRRFVRACIESSFGVAKTTPTLGTDACVLRLPDANAFKAEMTPSIEYIPYGGGRTTYADSVADVALVQGSVSTYLYPGIWTTLLTNWALTLINTGRTTPWVTTDASSVMPAGDLASMCFYHGFQNPDASYVREKWLGSKSTKGSIEGSAKDRKIKFTSDFIGIKEVTNAFISGEASAPDATEFPAPAETDYPTAPYLFSHVGSGTGTMKIGSARTQIESFKLSWENAIYPDPYEKQVIQLARFTGRKVMLEVGLRYKISPDDLASFQSQAAQASQLILDNGAHTFNLQMNGVNKITGRERDYTDGNEYATKITVTNFWDASAGSDVVLTLT